jgi:hypothetical protein
LFSFALIVLRWGEMREAVIKCKVEVFLYKEQSTFTNVNALCTCLEYLLVREKLAWEICIPCEWLWQAKRFLAGEERILTYHDILTLSRSVCSFAHDDSFAHSNPYWTTMVRFMPGWIVQ